MAGYVAPVPLTISKDQEDSDEMVIPVVMMICTSDEVCVCLSVTKNEHFYKACLSFCLFVTGYLYFLKRRK